MEWSCVECGTSASVESVRLLVAMGWQVIGDDACLCAVCTMRKRQGEVQRAARLVRSSAVRVRAESEQMATASRTQRTRHRGS